MSSCLKKKEPETTPPPTTTVLVRSVNHFKYLPFTRLYMRESGINVYRHDQFDAEATPIDRPQNINRFKVNMLEYDKIDQINVSIVVNRNVVNTTTASFNSIGQQELIFNPPIELNEGDKLGVQFVGTHLGFGGFGNLFNTEIFTEVELEDR